MLPRKSASTRIKEKAKSLLASVPELTAGQARWVHYSKNKNETDVKDSDDFFQDEEGFDTTTDASSSDNTFPSIQRPQPADNYDEMLSAKIARKSAASNLSTASNSNRARATRYVNANNDDGVFEEPPIENESGSARCIEAMPQSNDIASKILEMQAPRGSTPQSSDSFDWDGMSVVTGLSRVEALRTRNTDDLDGMSIITGISTAETVQIRNTIDMDGMSAVTRHSAATEVIRNSESKKVARPSSQGPSRPSSQGPSRPSSQGPSRPSSQGPSTTDSMNPPKRKRTTVLILPVDSHGTAISEGELKEQWARAGKCTECGHIQTHLKVKHGFLGMFRRLEPRTVPRKVYKGVCLLCNDIDELRKILNDDTIPLDLPRANRNDEMTASLRSLISGDDTDFLTPPPHKKSPIAVLCGSWKVQACLLICFILALGACVAAAIMLSTDPQEFIAPPPTGMPSASPSTSFPSMAPTSLEWVLVGEIVGNATESFAYSLSSNDEGTVIAVASPFARGQRGQVDVYSLVTKGNDISDPSSDGMDKWEKQGSSIIGDSDFDRMGMGMDLSSDGKILAIGAPMVGNGFVRIYRSYENDWVQVGQSLMGPSESSSFGFSVSLDKSGTRLAVGAPQHRDSTGAQMGYAQIYIFTGSEWIPFVQEGTFTPKFTGSRFGHSVSLSDDGNTFVVGAPEDDWRWQNGGQVYAYLHHTDSEVQGWQTMVENPVFGNEMNGRFGGTVKLCPEGDAFVSIEATSDNAGRIRVVGFDPDWRTASDVGFPVIGDPGTGLGSNVDIGIHGSFFSVSSQNSNGKTGVVRTFLLTEEGLWEEIEKMIPSLPLGNSTWFGKGPSLVFTQPEQIAVGYESVMIDGESKSVVHFYQFKWN